MYTRWVLVYCSKKYSIRITYVKKIVSRKKKKRKNVKNYCLRVEKKIRKSTSLRRFLLYTIPRGFPSLNRYDFFSRSPCSINRYTIKPDLY